MNVHRRSRSYTEIRRIWKIKRKLEQQHEAYKQYRIEKFNREKMSEERRRYQKSRRDSDRRRSRSHSRPRSRSRSRSSGRGNKKIVLSESQFERFRKEIENNVISRIGATISGGRTDRQSQTRTGDRRSPKSDYKHSGNKADPSRDRRDHESSISGKHLDRESSRHRRTPPERQRSLTERRRSRSPIPTTSQSHTLVPSGLQTQGHSPAQTRPRSPKREPERFRNSRCELCDKHHSSRDRNASCRTKPYNGRYPSRPQETNRPPRDHRDHPGRRWYRTEQQHWSRNTGPYPNHRGPAPFPVMHNPNWQDIPPPGHFEYIWSPPMGPRLPPPYRVPYTPYGPGPNFRGYH